MDKKIVLLNGPASSGKDHAAKYIVSNYKQAKLDKFARVLKERTHALYGFPWREWYYYEDCKDKPSDDFYGITPRQAYIGVSEKYFKPMHDDYIFGRLLEKELENDPSMLVAVSDSGFESEAKVLIQRYGVKNVILIRIHREGFTFADVNDSRGYIELPEIAQFDIDNPGDKVFTERVDTILEPWLKR